MQDAMVGLSSGPLLVPLLSGDIGQSLLLTVLAVALVAAAAGLVTDRLGQAPAR